MPFVVPDTIEIEVLKDVFTDNMTIRIYGNNVTPTSESKREDFTEIVGGGYASKPLPPADWKFTSGNPSYALFKDTQTWTFTGAVDAPGSIYGYYVTRNLDNKLVWAERFPSGLVPFVAQAGSIIKVLPKFTCQSAF